MNIKLPKLFTSIGITAAIAGSVDAALVVYEPFDMTVGENLENQPAGTGLSGSWTKVSGNTYVISSGNLTYGTLPTAGNAILPTAAARYSNNPSAALNGAGLLANGTTLWMSAVVRPLVGANSILTVRLGDNPVDAANNVSAGDSVGFNFQNGNDLQNRYNENGTATNPGTFLNNATTNQTLLVVIEMIWNADDNLADTINYYLPDTSLALGSVKATINTIDFNQASFDTLSFAVSDNGSADLDEIRFGSSYADVISTIPEPTCATLLGLGGLLLLRRRRI